MKRTSTRIAAFYFWLLCLLLALPIARAQAQSSEGLVADSTELRALHQLFTSTNGPSWWRHDNWPATPADWAQATLTQAAGWYGVNVTGGDVQGLYLSNIGVSGQLPHSIGLLTELRYFYLERYLFCCPDAMSLGGTLPKELGQLHHLQTLVIQFNNLGGPIPPELGNLSELQDLELENNNLSGPIPPELGNLTQLRTLILDNYYRGGRFGYFNHFSGGIPATLARLTNLTSLSLGDSPLGGELPAVLGQLTQLQALAVDDANLHGALAASILSLPNLTYLNLGEYNMGYAYPNALTSLPSPNVIANPASLQLRLSYNQFNFGQLEPYFTAPGQLLTGPGSTYLPQAQAPLAPDTSQRVANAAVTLDGTLPGAHNHYQWQRLISGQWLDVPGQTQAQLSWAQVTPAQTGRYRARVTNDLVTGLTLYSRVHLLDVLPYPPLARNLPDAGNPGAAVVVPPATADATAAQPADMNYVRTWVPRVALRHGLDQPSAAQCTATGRILREEWDNVSGTQVNQIPLQTLPTSITYLLALEGPTDSGDNYGDRIRGYLCPPQTGQYTFWIAGDDSSELWLSTDDDPTHKVRIASVPIYTGSREWNKYPEQQSAAIALVQGHRYYVEVLHKEGVGGDNLAVAWQLPSGTIEGPISGSHLSPAPALATAAVLREEWDQVGGTQISDIPLGTPPTRVHYLPTLEGPVNSGDEYGDRMRAYLTAPQTGNYTFWIAGDDQSQLWLSTDENPTHKVNLATVPGYTDPRQWDKYPEQQSALVSLVAGQRYYVEVLHKEGGGGDNVAVAWRLPDGTIEGPIAGSHLSAFTLPTPGLVLREQWNVGGGAISDIPLHAAPASTGYVATLETASGLGNDYGARLSGYLTAPLTGNYTFWVAGDDAAELWLSPDADSSHQVRRAYTSRVTGFRQYDADASQQSAPVPLVAGQRYYVRVLHKQQGGGDHLSVAWQLPDGARETPIASFHLAPVGTPLTVPAAGSPAAGAGSTASTSLRSSWTVDSASITTQYLDGLGRPVQTVQHQASPQRRDLVQVQAYDALGREPKAYLPYAVDSAGTGRLGYHHRALTQQQQFYAADPQAGPPSPSNLNAGVARTGVAFAETQFEASPLSRVLAQGAPGEAWQLMDGHHSERLERPNTATDSVLYFKPGYDPKSLDPGYQRLYAPGELWGVQVTEPQRPDLPGEQGPASIEWKDKLGQVVGKQVEVARTGSMSQGLHRRWLRTAYVYDDLQRLRFVLQPEGVKRLLAPPAVPAPPLPAVTTLATGLQLWLKLDEAAGQLAADSSGLDRAGTLSVPSGGQATWLPAGGHNGLGGALQLRGGARLTVPLSWQPTRFSVSFWLQPSDLFNYSQGTGAGQGWGGFLFHSTYLGEVYVGTDVASRLALTGQNAVEIRAWQHFVFTFDQGVATLYKNGQVIASRSDMNPAQPWQNFVLGISGDETYDEVRVYDRPLTQTEVRALYQPVVAPAPVSAVPDFLFHYRYDARGRQIAKQVPGQDGETLVVYDQLDRPVLSQDAQQRQRQEWSWSKYDALGRVVLTGLVTRADTAGQVTLQNLATADTAAAHQYEQRTADVSYAQHYTTGQAFPKLGQNGFGTGLVLTASYYDDYDFDNNGQADTDAHYTPVADAAFASGQAPVADEARVMGLPTRTLTRVLNRPNNDPGAEWLSTTSFYDERGRVIQTQSSNARGGQDVVTLQLDFLSKPVRSVARHQGPSLPAPIQVVETMQYDHAERLLRTSQQLPGEAALVPLSRRAYNELGQLLVDSLASGRLAQNVKYAYNIRGWLTSLNNPYAPAPQDLFNLSLHYEAGFTTGYEQYNGNLTGQTWRGRDGVQRAYGYVYDPLNRLLQGDFVARTTTASPSTGAWQAEADHYRLSFVSYDDNGNLNTLRRQGLLQAATHNKAPVFGAVDNLTYAYQGNRLQAVEDQVSGNQLVKPASYHGAPTSLAGDFQEGGVHQGQEYLYDANGNLTADKNKNITGILYNHLNLPRQVHFGQVGDSVVFRYAASGQKVAKLVYQTGKSTPTRTDYLGPYQYEQDSLKFFPHAAGRVLRFVSYDAANQPTVRYQREYTLKDHLGNLRLAYRAGQVRRLLATLEQDETTHKRETQQFDSLSVSVPIAASTGLAHSGQYAARLNAGTDNGAPQPLGPLTQLGVQKGDTVRVQAFGYYQQPVQHGFIFSLASFIANLFHPAQAPPPGLEAQKRKGFPILQVGVAAGLASIPQLSGGVPKGYLRVLVFNKDSALVRQRTWQLSQTAAGGFEQLGDTVRVSQDGYVTVYVGNESDVDVLFDDVSVEHRPGLQVQETQYDPVGLELAGLTAPSPGIKGLNNYRFNGKEFQADLGLNWNHQDWRFFDPQLLRWHSVDRLIEHDQEGWTPYQFGFDNAVRYNDPDGECPTCLTALAGAAIGAVIGGGIEVASQYYHDGKVSNWGAVGGAALQGGVTGGVAGLTGGASLVVNLGSSGAANAVGGAIRNVAQGKAVTVGSVVRDAAIGVAGAGAAKIVGAAASVVAAKGQGFAQKVFSSTKLGVGSSRLGNKFVTGVPGSMNQPGSAIKFGWSGTGANGGGQQLRVGIGQAAANAKQAAKHIDIPGTFVPNNVANPIMQAMRKANGL